MSNDTHTEAGKVYDRVPTDSILCEGCAFEPENQNCDINRRCMENVPDRPVYFIFKEKT